MSNVSSDFKMKRRFCFVIIVILVVAILYSLFKNDNKLQHIRTGMKGRKYESIYHV